jgi:signal transduction histidine kinase
MADARNARPSLVRTTTSRLAWAAAIAIALQICVVIAQNYLNDADLVLNYVTRQADVLASRAKLASAGVIELQDEQIPSQYTGLDERAYAFRMTYPDGKIIQHRNGQFFDNISPWTPGMSRGQDLWLDVLDASKKLFVAGGRRLRVGDQEILVEVATLGDPAHAFLGVLAMEIVDDVWLPMIPLVVLILGVSVISVRKSLKPLALAAQQAENISPLQNGIKIDESTMTREVGILIDAINGLLDRLRKIFETQQLFIARAAHELKTPLAIMLMELGRVEEQGTARLEADIKSMSQVVNGLLTMARLENNNAISFVPIDLGTLTRDIITHMDMMTNLKRHRISLNVQDLATCVGDPTAIREALRNVLDNALIHTPAEADIHVNVGPGSIVTVEDSGSGWAGDNPESFLQPFTKGESSSEGAGLGLSIVKQVIDTHGGAIELGQSSLGGALIRLNFAAKPGQSLQAGSA